MVTVNGKLFDWDIKKNLINIEKHGVSFKMAASAFFDPKAVKVDDDFHSQDEDRFILIGGAVLRGKSMKCDIYSFFKRNESRVLLVNCFAPQA